MSIFMQNEILEKAEPIVRIAERVKKVMFDKQEQKLMVQKVRAIT